MTLSNFCVPISYGVPANLRISFGNCELNQVKGLAQITRQHYGKQETRAMMNRIGTSLRATLSFAHAAFLSSMVLVMLSSVALPSGARATLDPAIPWQQIETPHFRIVYDSRHYPLAKLYAEYAEQG